MNLIDGLSWDDWITISAIVLGALAGVIVLRFVLVTFRGLRSREADFESGLTERLAEYPPAPEIGAPRIRFEGLPVRIRLVVVAPSGRGGELRSGMVYSTLDAILYGLGDAAKHDQPRVRVWPPQLSQQGFAPAFFRRTVRPEAKDKPSAWILVAGPARVGANVVLLGLALQGREPSLRGSVVMKVENWPDRFRIQTTE